MQISAFGPCLVGLENIQETVLTLSFAHLTFYHIKGDLIQSNSHLTNNKIINKKTNQTKKKQLAEDF